MQEINPIDRGLLAGAGQFIGLVMVFVGWLWLFIYGNNRYIYRLVGIFLIILIIVTVVFAYKYNIFNCFLSIIARGWGGVEVNCDAEDVNKFISYVGLFDAFILIPLVIVSGGLAKSVYSPIFLIIPPATLLFIIDPYTYKNCVIGIMVLILAGIFLSHILYIYQGALKERSWWANIYKFWNNNQIKGHSTCVFIITLLCSTVIVLEAIIKLVIRK